MGGRNFILLSCLCVFANSSPILNDGGFQEFVVVINDDVPQNNSLIQVIKDILTETSEMMYYASLSRFYIKDVRILVPSSWTDIPHVLEDRFGDIYEEADIQIATRNTAHGDAPYTHQPGDCFEEGNPIHISDRFLMDLMESKDEMILKYGPISKVLTQEFTKYRYGYFEEYGYPGKKDNGEDYPSTYTEAYLNKDGIWRMAALNNACSDTPLEGKRLHIEGEKKNSTIVEGCEIDQESGEITSDSCFFAADVENVAFTSMASYQYTSLVSVFCDDDFFPHNPHARNKHNEKCIDDDNEPMSTWSTILRHTDFENGHNGGDYVESTVPNFRVYRASVAKFVLVVDNSGSMSSCYRLDNMKTSLKRWVDRLKVNTMVALVKFGSSVECASGDHTFTNGCYLKISAENDGIEERKKLRNAIDEMGNMGSTYMSEALQSAYQIMQDEYNINEGQPGVVMLVTDGMANGPGPAIDDQQIWKPFQLDRIRVVTLNIGSEIDTRMQHLVKHTGGKAFVSKDCSGTDADDAFQYLSQTFIPKDIGDKYLQKQITSKGTVQGLLSYNHCSQQNDGKQCLKHSFTIEKTLNKEVNINMKMSQEGNQIDAQEFVNEVSVRRRLDQTFVKMNPEVNGFSLSFEDEYKNYADFSHIGVVPDEFTEQILDVYLTPKFSDPPTHQEIFDFTHTTVEFETSAKRNFDGEEDADYWITCNHPPVMTANEEFKIESQVLRGTTPIDHANVKARITVSRPTDPNGDTPPVYFTLYDNGDNGDEHKNDGTYTTIVAASQINVDGGEGITVMCNMVESPDAKWDEDNDFFGGKKSLPTQNENTPYCCGTKDQKWNIPRTQDVTKLLRSSLQTGAFLDSSLFVKDADFGPPGRISDLKAEIVGNPEEGLVRLRWTATGDDWYAGTASSYNLVYSDKRKGLMKSNKVNKDSRSIHGGSLEPVPAREKMEVVVKIENLHVPGTYMFALNATDDVGKVSRPSNIARVNLHDGSPVVLDAEPHLVYGHANNDLPFDEKIRRITGDERIVQGFMALIEKNKKMVRDAENNVMEKRLKEKMGRGGKSVKRIMDKIKNDDVLRAIYKSKLL